MNKVPKFIKYNRVYFAVYYLSIETKKNRWILIGGLQAVYYSTLGLKDLGFYVYSDQLMEDSMINENIQFDSSKCN